MDIFEEKQSNSDQKIRELSLRIRRSEEVRPFKNLAVYATGSYARGEASVHSDIDLFFINRRPLETIPDCNINSVRLFSRMIEIAREMNFPKFSNDGAYLKILDSPQILKHLGGPNDDYMNHFTARLLLILESKPVYGKNNYEAVLKSVLDRYFEDYPDHPGDFHPTFLVNDIMRFWKTLCLNYENKRNQPARDEAKRIAQKVKNLKLKFSRMLTCFGSVCYLASEKDVVGPDELMEMTRRSPMERLRMAADRANQMDRMARIEEEYRWFLTLTNVSEAELMANFSEKELRREAFEHASVFGGEVFDVTRSIAERNGYLRYLVV